MNILIGIYEIATGRVRGLARFGATPRDFMVSLCAPMVVLVLVLALAAVAMMTRRGFDVAATTGLLAGYMAVWWTLRLGFVGALSLALPLICLLLAPAVISHLLARLWGREAQWLRFATVFNWSRVALIGVFLTLLLLTSLAIQLGMPYKHAGGILFYTMLIYALWLEWFVARHTLLISNLRAFATIIAIKVGSSIVIAIPGLIVRLLTADAPAG